MPTNNDHQGYVRLPTLIMVAVPCVTILAGGIALYVNMAVAPLAQDIQRLRDSARDQRDQMVPRAEHIEKWASQRDRDQELQREIDGNRDDIKSIYRPNDALKAINDRLDRLEDKLKR